MNQLTLATALVLMTGAMWGQVYSAPVPTESVVCATTAPPPWDAHCNHVDPPPQQSLTGILYAKPQDAPQTAAQPLKCGKYQHVERRRVPCAGNLNSDVVQCYEVGHCADDLHTVTEAEWQALMARLAALEKGQPITISR